MANLTCPHCGTANRIGSNFCNKCGTSLREEEAPRSGAEDGGPVDAISRAAELAASQITPSQEPDDAPENDEAVRELDQDAAQEAALVEPLPPLFDLGLASIKSSRDDSLTTSQPWLRESEDDSLSSDMSGSGTTQSTENQTQDDRAQGENPDDQLTQAGSRLVGGVQGLLDPLNITNDTDSPADTSDAILPTPIIDELSTQQVRRMRRIMSEEPVLAAQLAPLTGTRNPSLRIPWIFWILGLAVVLPVFGILREPVGAPMAWPGVAQTYATIQGLPPGADILIYMAYDPATSGELDLVAQPVVRHLLRKRANLTFVSLLPGGPATARRLVRSVLAAEMEPEDVPFAMNRITMRNFYLTGGASVLPLLGQAPASLSASTQSSVTLVGATTPPAEPDLAVIMAARTEDVQHWLELVQTVEPRPERTTVVAVTGAGVDPMVRPYLDSGQLSGLVSGFDGAESYQRLQAEPAPKSAQIAARVQTVAQNWAHIALLFVLLMGNVAGFLNRGNRKRGQ